MKLAHMVSTMAITKRLELNYVISMTSSDFCNSRPSTASLRVTQRLTIPKVLK
jgi:hypothetical protein